MAARRRADGMAADVADVADADAARAIERQMEKLQERVRRGGVMEYLKPLAASERKDVNKLFLSSTIRSVDSHNRRHEEEKCWKIRELERKLDNRHHHRRARSRSRSRSDSPDRRRRSHKISGDRSASPSKSRRRDRDRRHRSRSRSRSRDRLSRSTATTTTGNQSRSSTDQATTAGSSDAEREFWAAKKTEKTKKMWDAMHAGTTTVLVKNAPEFSSDDNSDDEDERVQDTDANEAKVKKQRKTKKHKKEKKHKSRKDDHKKRKRSQ